MSPNEFDFNLDSILEEFSHYSESIGTEEKSEAAKAEEISAPAIDEAPAEAQFVFEEPKAAEPSRPVQDPQRRQSAPRRVAPKAEPEEDPFYSLKERIQTARAERPAVPRTEKRREESQESRREQPAPSLADKYRDVKKSRSHSESPAPKADKRRDLEEAAPRRADKYRGTEEKLPRKMPKAEPKPEAAAKPASPLTPLIGLICGVLMLLGIVWVGLNVHPGSSASSGETATQKLDLVSQLDVSFNNLASDAMGDLAYIRKVYKIDENATFGPAPDPNRYGTVAIEDAAQILDIVKQAEECGLLEGQTFNFDPNANFYHLSNIQYYFDETILVVCWKEQIEGKVCSFVEVKIADASQFRRKITEDTYGSSVKQYASQLSASANAVVAMNADFYNFRSTGMVVYQRELYRFNAGNYNGNYKMYNALDHCFIDSKGDLLLMHQGEEYTREEMEQYLADKDILFGLAFGPILVENGEIRDYWTYPAGEINTEYSRAGIGQLDSLHYLFMTVNWSDENTPRATVSEFARIFHSKGVRTAYCLDGGQTSEIVMNDIPFNRIDFNAERTVSDIIYFATAIPESEVTK